MGMLDKLKFWKKDDEFGDLDLDKDLGMDSNLGLGVDSNTGIESGLGLDKPPSHNIPKIPESFEESIGQEKQDNFNPYESPKRPDPMQQPMQQQQPVSSNIHNQDLLRKDLEIISAKLDVLKSSLDTINHRLSSLEQKEKRW